MPRPRISDGLRLVSRLIYLRKVYVNDVFSQGRWPQKSAKVIKELIGNAVSNAEYHGLDVDSLRILHIQVNPAPLGRRKTYRAHGVVTPYMSHPSHLQIILSDANH